MLLAEKIFCVFSKRRAPSRRPFVLSELLEKVVKLASESLVRSRHRLPCLMDQATEELYFDVALGRKRRRFAAIRLKKGEGIAGWVAVNRRPRGDNVAVTPLDTKSRIRPANFNPKRSWPFDASPKIS